ncbi:Pyridoxine/pyridoxamine [Carex littledalei]|uniref:Pyridoxine/pyridoxamine n=1 Tax=Carex littledalei TaxID=544730 RepID=A0A833R102_9POAL|nr:Pyridoxine/pyridoxamine [Carex littledalei]
MQVIKDLFSAIVFRDASSLLELYHSLGGLLSVKQNFFYRGFEEGSDKIEINTDTRSNKIEEIKHFSFSEGTDGGISSSKYCYISGFDATRKNL